MEEKDKLVDATEGKEIFKRKKIEEKIDKLLLEINIDLSDLEKEYKAQTKKKNKYTDLETKEKILELLKEKVKILKNKYNGEEVEEELIDNQTALEKLENILEKRKEMGENSDERELYEEENDKIEDWKARVKDQDEMLDEVEEGVKNIKNEAERAGEGISNINKKVKKTQKKMDKTSKKVKTQNDKLKDLVEQIRSSDKICCDLILILILLGLICVLYSVIKHKFIKK